MAKKRTSSVTVTKDEIDKGLAILKNVLAE